MNPGDVVRTGRVEVHVDCGDGVHVNRFGFKPPNKGDKFNFIFIGLQKKGEPEINANSFLRSIGWVPMDEVEKIK